MISKIKLLAKKVYELSRKQVSIIKKYIDKILEKKFIKLNYFLYATLILIVKKSKSDFRVYIDYRALNALTIKNRNVLFLIREILAKLYLAKYFSKFDIIVIFNEIRIREKNEKKTTFLTRYELFEYVIILFELCNALEIFQIFINDILREYLDDFCLNYLDDILIYNNIYENYIIYIFKVLERLIEVELFLNINKCEFFVQKIKYLDLIITIERVKINSQKIEIIVD